MTLKCACGKEVEDWRGARGHAKFKGGEPHGDPMQMPDDWRSIFTEIDGDDSSDEPEDDEPDPEPVDRTTDRETDDAGPSPDEDDEPDANPGTLRDRLTKAATDDVRHLWRDDL